jgi:transcription antitermination factor NusG
LRGIAMFAEWFVVRSKPGQVARALSNLKRQNYESYAPKCFDPLTRKHSYLFVDYLFVKMPFTAQWRSIRSTYGVLEIVVFGECPATITQEEINRLRDRENDLGVIEMPSDPFVLDEGLRVKSGHKVVAFDDMDLSFEMLDVDNSMEINYKFVQLKGFITNDKTYEINKFLQDKTK